MENEIKQMVYHSKRIIDLLYKGKYRRYSYYVMNLGTHPTAYVEISKDNCLYFKSYNEIYDMGCDIIVHGGLTYSNKCLLISNDTKLDNSWFIGWDYAHCNDFTGTDLTYPEFATDGKKWTTNEIIKECKNVIEQIIEINELFRNKIYISNPTSISIGTNTWCDLDTKLVGRIKALIEEKNELQLKNDNAIKYVEYHDVVYNTGHIDEKHKFDKSTNPKELLNILKENK